MKIIAGIIIPFMLISHNVWLTDFNEARIEAAQKHELILLNFSGSDWCGPCIRLRKEIFESNVFKKYADAHLVLVNADFPRLNKNKLPKELEKQNNALADKYDQRGTFPYTLLINTEGKVIKDWDGYPKVSPEVFVKEVETIFDADR